MLLCLSLRPYINSKSVELKKPLNVDHIIIFITVATSIALLQEFIRCCMSKGNILFGLNLKATVRIKREFTFTEHILGVVGNRINLLVNNTCR